MIPWHLKKKNITRSKFVVRIKQKTIKDVVPFHFGEPSPTSRREPQRHMQTPNTPVWFY